MHKKERVRRDREREGSGALKSYTTTCFTLEELVLVERISNRCL